MKIRFTVLLVAFTFIFNSCFAPNMFVSGVEYKILDEKSFLQASRVALLPLSIPPISEKQKYEADALTDSLWKELNVQHIFFLIPEDSVRLVLKVLPKDDTLFSKRFSENLAANAFIQPEIVYTIPPGYGKTYTATLNLYFLDSSNQKPIAFFSYDTFLGNTYILPPRLEQVTFDAIKSGAQALAKNMIKLRNKH